MNILLNIFWLTFIYIYNEHKPGNGKFLSHTVEAGKIGMWRGCAKFTFTTCAWEFLLFYILNSTWYIYIFSFYFCICWMAMLVIINRYFIMVIFCISLMAFHIYWSFVYPQNGVKSLSCVWLFVTPWTVAYQAPPSLGFSRQEYRSGLPFPSPGDLPNPGFEPRSPVLQADALPSKPPGKAQRGF